MILDGCEWSVSHPGYFIPREGTPGTNWVAGWVGPRTDLDTMINRKNPALLVTEPQSNSL
jgi:hypothetical protein